MSFQYWASAKLCGVEQRAPPIFGRAAITLGIGPHSSFIFNSCIDMVNLKCTVFWSTLYAVVIWMVRVSINVNM